MAEVAIDTESSRDPSSRRGRRKKRMSREIDDYTNESIESPSSLPERIPLQDVADGDKGGVTRSASNNSGDQEGSSGIPQSTSERKNRARRQRRRSRMENGDVYDGMESKTLDIPEKKRYKRPASGVTRHARSASAEVINRDEEDMMGDNENFTPARRRPRRKRTHGSRDVINGEEYTYDYDGYDGPGDSKRTRPKKNKTKKSQRQQTGTSAEEDNYNADNDEEASIVDYYKVDKEDIVVSNTSETSPPALPPVAQTLPSQPLDVVFIERRDGQGFTRERKTRLMQMEEERNKEPEKIPSSMQMTTAEFAVSVHKAFRSFSVFCHGLLAGLALCQVIFVYSLSNNSEGDVVFLENYYKLAQPLQSLYYMLFAICTVSVFDRYDMANPRSGFFRDLLSRPSRILSISAYLFAMVFSISVANIDDRISLYKVHSDLWGHAETSSLLDTWRIINLMRVLGAVLGWVLVSAQPSDECTAENLYEGELLPGEQRLVQQRAAKSEPQLVV
ncbi:hypothetical protein pdam_00010103 [Pocillopora damicornis]|uniref:Transmembrane protein 237 n=1 Tax=Pocillopora damicornis TaxID=46731 RepID=A0A3M6V2I1_POCDA|nr:transmembrane protein 237-like [Pocillopora damicornis]RMX60153.1 hypothetical protein pdam_00010103 [Pocillopora damicornis]